MFFYCYLLSSILVILVYFDKVSGSESDLTGKDPSENCLNSTAPNCTNSCEANEFRCNNGKCIYMSELCDGVDNCLDNSDESQYCIDRHCNPYQFKCVSGKCIPNYYVCSGQNDCLDGSDEAFVSPESLEPPIVTIISESNPLNGNASYMSMNYEDTIRLRLICEADYPVEWMFNFENVVGSPEIERGNVLEAVGDYGTWNGTFRNELEVNFEQIFDTHVLYCRSVTNPCTQQMVVSEFDEDEKKVNFKISDKANRKIVSIFSTQFGDNQSNCEAIWYYQDIGEYGIWRCAQPNGKPGEISTIKCQNDSLCNNYFRNNRQPRHCVRSYIDGVTCNDCKAMNDYARQGRIIECYHEDEILRSYTLQVYNSLAVGNSMSPNIYFDLKEAPFEELLILENFREDIYVGEDIYILCRASAYVFHPNLQIAFEFESGDLEFLEIDPNSREYKAHENEHITQFYTQVLNSTLKRVYCIGFEILNSKLTNTSKSVIIQVPVQPMLMVQREFDSDEYQEDLTDGESNQFWKNETIQWDYGDVDKSIHCNVSGRPLPVILWSKDGQEFEPSVKKQSDSWSFSQLHFNTVNETTAGFYNCEAGNIASNHTKYFQISVKGSAKTAGIIGGAVASFVILAVLSGICVKVYRKSKSKKEKPKNSTRSTVL